MNRSQRILLSPTNRQRSLMAGACGLSRFAWNWALALCERHYRMFGKKEGYKRLGGYRLTKHWNKVKGRRFPWVTQYSKYVAEQNFKCLDLAYEAAFTRLKQGKVSGFPRFHKKGTHESFHVVPSGHKQIRRIGRRFNLPRIGFVKCQTPLRWPDAKQVKGRVRYKAGQWWLTLAYELPDPARLPVDRPTCGIDLGCTTFATVASNGVIVDEVKPPKPYAKAKRKLRRLQKTMCRRKKGGSNRRKAVLRLSRQYARVANVRANFLHQLTSRLVRRFGTIVLEDLNVRGMMGGMLADTVRDMGFGEFRRQVEYKAETAGTKVVVGDRNFPSSKLCSSCGLVKTKLELRERTWTCECGVTHNRDHNAALNLEKLPQGMGKVTPAEIGSPSPRKGARCRSKKQERTTASNGG